MQRHIKTLLELFYLLKLHNNNRMDKAILLESTKSAHYKSIEELFESFSSIFCFKVFCNYNSIV